MIVACSPEPSPGADDEAATDDNATDDEAATDEAATDDDSATSTESESAGDESDGTDTTTGEDPGEVPEASRCIDHDLNNNCIELSAGTWTDDAHYVWRQVGDDVTHSVIERVPAMGEPMLVAELSSSNWHTLGGLAVAPDGTLWISGASLASGVDLIIDEVPIVLDFPYTWFVAHLDPSGLVLDQDTYYTETAARTLLAARADGSVFLAGDLVIANPAEFGDTTLEPSFNADIVIARLDAHGQPLWARQRPADEFGSLGLFDMVQSADGLAIVDVVATGSTTFDDVTVACPMQGGCNVRWTFDADGIVVDGELMP